MAKAARQRGVSVVRMGLLSSVKGANHARLRGRLYCGGDGGRRGLADARCRQRLPDAFLVLAQPRAGAGEASLAGREREIAATRAATGDRKSACRERG